MSLVKSRQEFRTILDFSKGELTKNKLKFALRQIEILECEECKDTTILIVSGIRIGMYHIDLILGEFGSTKTPLRKYGKFRVNIYEVHKDIDYRYIFLPNDERFKNQYWSKLNKKSDLRIKNLIDIIMYLKRLNNLKAFS